MSNSQCIKVACVGARSTPPDILTMMEDIGEYIVSQPKCVLASGNATGADQAFARGGNKVDSMRVWLYLPWQTYESQAVVWGNRTITDWEPGTRIIAARNHPNWERLSFGVKRLMIRNAGLLMGSSLVIGYLDHSKPGGGGTGHGWRIAEDLGIERIDLSKNQDIEDIKQMVSEKNIRINE